MLPRRRRAPRRYGKKKYVRRGLRRVRKAAPSVHKFKEMFKDTSVGATAGGFGSGILAVGGLSQLQNVGSFQTMFDLYKITGVKYTIIPRFNTASIGEASATSSLPMLYLATNRDPFTPAPVSIADILNDDTCKVFRLTRPISWYVKAPKPDMSVSFDIQGTQYVAPQNWQLGVATKYQPWLTTGGNNQTLSQIGLKHYGVRWAIDNLDDEAISIDVYTTVYFQCKEQN